MCIKILEELTVEETVSILWKKLVDGELHRVAPKIRKRVRFDLFLQSNFEEDVYESFSKIFIEEVQRAKDQLFEEERVLQLSEYEKKEKKKRG